MIEKVIFQEEVVSLNTEQDEYIGYNKRIFQKHVSDSNDIGVAYTDIKQKGLHISANRAERFNDYCRGILKCSASLDITRRFDEDTRTKKVLKTGSFILAIVYRFYDTKQDISLIKLKHPELYEYLIKDIRKTSNYNRREYLIHNFFMNQMDFND